MHVRVKVVKSRLNLVIWKGLYLVCRGREVRRRGVRARPRREQQPPRPQQRARAHAVRQPGRRMNLLLDIKHTITKYTLKTHNYNRIYLQNKCNIHSKLTFKSYKLHSFKKKLKFNYFSLYLPTRNYLIYLKKFWLVRKLSPFIF